MNGTNTIYKKIIKDYWANKVAGIDEVFLPTLDPSQKKKVKILRAGLDTEVAQTIGKLANYQEMTVFVVFLSFYHQLIARYFQAKQVLIASPSLNQIGSEKIEDNASLVFFKLQTSLNEKVKELLMHTRAEVLEVMNHQEFNFQDLLDLVDRNAIDPRLLYQYGFYYDQVNAPSADFSKVKLQVGIYKVADTYEVEVCYDATVYNGKLMQQLLTHYQHLLKHGVGQLDLRAADLPLLSTAAQEQLLHGYNQTQTAYPSNALIHELFEVQVQKNPHARALVVGAEVFTYAQLNAQANLLAHYLRNHSQVKPDDRVGLLVNRSSAWIIGLLGILKSGAAYVPIDPSYPAERIQFVLQDTSPRVLLTHSDFLFDLQFYEGELFALDIQLDTLQESTANLPLANLPTDLAYVMYTSGSTGTAKGVMIPHRSVIRLVKNTSYVKLSKEDRLLVTGALAFDATTFEIWGMLLNGGSLHILTDDQLLDTQYLKNYVREQGITTMWFTSSWFNQLVDREPEIFAPLKYLLVGGEKLSPLHVNQVRAAYPTLKVVNGYGPTENTTFSICHVLNKTYSQDIPLGKPIANTTVYILDAYLHPVPTGVRGEIYLGGDGLARGYLNSPDLTAEKFIVDPFSVGGRLYKTGDVGMWQFDGTIAFVGRQDGQVKVRGYRIEAGEIEHALRSIAGVKEAVVLDRKGSDGNTELVAYYLSNQTLSTQELRAQLSTVLPTYMIPAYFIPLERIPLTPNGKLDRRALPSPEEVHTRQNTYVEPQNETERALVDIWQEVLGKEKIGVYDNFFEIGGHSLKATQVVSRIEQELETKIDLSHLFLSPTIHELATIIQGTEKQAFERITPVAEQAYYELSHAQRRLWILNQFEGNQTAYNMPLYYLLYEVKAEALEKAIQTVVARHESLRTTFVMVDGEVKQKVNPVIEGEFLLTNIDLSGYENSGREAERLAKKEIETPFSLEEGPLVRAQLIHLGLEKSLLLFNMHHIISDGWSIKVLMNEVLTLYKAYSAGLENPLPPLRIQYKDYAAWQNQRLNEQNIKIQQQYWWDRFSGELPILELPSDYPRPAVKTYHGNCLSLPMGKEMTRQLTTYSQQRGASLFMTLLASVKTLLYKYSGQEDIIIGSPIAGRDHKDLENQIGFYVNTLAFRTQIRAKESFDQLVTQIKEQALKAYEYQVYPFDHLVDDLHLTRDLSRSPLFDVMVVLLNIDGGEAPADSSGEETVSVFNPGVTVSKFDLTFGFSGEEELILSIEYNTDLFAQERILRMSQHLLQLFQSILQDSTQPVCTLGYLTAEEKHQLAVTFNNTKSSYAKKKVYELFEAQVSRSPEVLAAVFDEQSLTYEAFNRRANQVAHYLRNEHLIKPGDLVGVMMERSVQMPVVLMGILKSGAAYVPIDPQYPEERIQFMLEDSGLKLLLTERALLKYMRSEVPVFLLENTSDLTGVSEENPVSVNQLRDLAYIIYTSGSTGKPKGIEITHKNLTSFIHWATEEFKHAQYDRLLATTSYCFDLSIFELFFPLTLGKTIQVLRSGLEIKNYLSTGEKLLINTVPSVVEGLLLAGADLTNVSVLNMAGEPIPPHFKEVLNYEATEIRNLYGPSEDTTYSTIYRFRKDIFKTIPIGKPIANTQVYILDAHLQLLPVGVPGEICLSGDGLAKGYLNRKALTKEKFIRHPHLTGARMYRTGDLGRWSNDGTLEFLGRRDSQVKVRGYRIELEEIEQVLLQHTGVSKAVVLVREHANHSKSIVAFYTGERTLEEAALREHLSKQVPAYMLPSQFCWLSDLPLTPNGKTDKKKLLEGLAILGDRAGAGPKYVPARNPLEQQLVTIWQEVSGKEKIGIYDNFFLIGGDSIKAIQVVSRLHKVGYQLSIKDIFQEPVIAQLALRVRRPEVLADQLPVKGLVALTPIQQAFFQVQTSTHSHFNQSVMIYADKGLEPEVVIAVFTQLQQHHDALRMTYRRQEDKLLQENQGLAMPLSLQVFNWKGEDIAEARVRLTEEASAIQASMDLENGPLMRLGLFQLADGDRLLIAIHHLVVDGVSWRILFEDIEALYQQGSQGKKLELPLKTFSFQTWAERLSAWANHPDFQSEIAYWGKMPWKGVDPLVPDFEVGRNWVADAETGRFELSQEETQRLLTQTNQVFNTEINDILLVALAKAVQTTFHRPKVVVELEGHGREALFDNVDISRTIGWFTSLYPVVLENKEEQDLPRQIKEVKESLRQIPSKGLGYGTLKYLTSQERKEGIDWEVNAPIVFNYLGQFDQDVKNSSFDMAEEFAGPTQSPSWPRTHPFEISGMVADQRLAISITYSKQQYKPETVQQLLENYQQALIEIIRYCSSREDVSLTPSDFTFKKLDIDTVDQLSKSYILEDLYPLSPMQEGMLFQTAFDNDSSAYLNQASYRLLGDLNPALVEQSLGLLANRHEVLRTVFLDHLTDQPLQLVLKNQGVAFYFEDLRSKEEKETRELYVRTYKRNDQQRSFNLAKEVSVRMAMLQVDDHEFEFVWCFHHIVMDGWCISILIAEFLEIYSSLLENREVQLLASSPYRKYIQWLEEQQRSTAERYWHTYLNGYELASVVPRGTSMISEQSKEIQTVSLRFNQGKTKRLQELAAKNHATLNTVLQVAWGILLAKYNRSRDVVFGSVVSGRPSQIVGIESIIGLFINTVPVRVAYSPETTFEDLIARVQEEAIESERYHFYPLADIQAMSPLKSQLFDHMINFENYPIAEQIEGMLEESRSQEKGLQLELANIELFAQNYYEFSVLISLGSELTVQFKHTQAYETALVQGMAKHLQVILEQVIEQPRVAIDQIQWLSVEEKQHVLNDFNTTAAYPADCTMHALFEAQVARTPQQVAVVYQNSRWTYAELNAQANRLAHHLRQHVGVKPDDLVGLMVNRSERMIVGILGILKAGAAYVPIDPSYPEDRKAFILADAGIQLLLTDSEIKDSIPAYQHSLFLLDTELPALSTSVNNPAPINQVSDLAYVIYTSGSTGKPKGVMIEHRGNVNMSTDQVRRFGITAQDKVLQFASLSFDASVYEICMAFYAGATLVLLDKQQLDNTSTFEEYLQAQQVTVATLPPAYLNSLDKASLRGLRVLITAGEAANVADALACSAFCDYYNAYGPTEASVCVSTYLVSGQEQGRSSLPIGKPIANISLYVLDEQGNLLPVGLAGELCVSGIGLARGYLNRPELTLEKFVANPYQAGERLYKTGDLARWNAAGELEFMGRMDEQVKLRGYRIEPGEIVSVLSQHPAVGEAWVMKGAADELLAIVVPRKEVLVEAGEQKVYGETLLHELKQLSARQLPSYMVPTVFKLVENLPLTLNGKVDKKALLRLPGLFTEAQPDYVAARNELEQQLVELWQEVLGKTPIGIHDNFFELGGHSLKATKLVSWLYRSKGVKLELKSVFLHPTIASLAQLVGTSSQTIFEEIPLIEEQASYELSHAQRRLWILQQFEENKTAYNVPSAYVFSGEVNLPALQAAFQALIERHESLRTTFVMVDGEPKQLVHPAESWTFHTEAMDLREHSDKAARLRQLMHQEEHSVFDLEKGPLLRSKIFQLEDQTYVFLFTMHHIISDGWSMEVFIREVTQLYTAYNQGEVLKLPDLRIQYKEYAAWQKSQLSGQNLERHQAFWWGQFHEEQPVLALPTDYPRPFVKTFNGRTHTDLLAPELLRGLNLLAQQSGATLFMVLEALWKTLLYKYTGQEDLTLGTPLAGRHHPDLENQIGYYINTLALRTQFSGKQSFRELLQQIKVNTMEAFTYQAYPFDRLIDELPLSRDMSRSPLFDVMMVLQNFEEKQAEVEALSGVTIEGLQMDNTTSQFDLKVVCKEVAEGLLISLDYNTDLFKPNSIVRLIGHLQTLTESILRHADASLESLGYLTAAEEQQVLREFNQTQTNYPANKCIHELFEAMAARQPEAAAMVYQGQVWSYAQVNEQANSLAAYLVAEYGVSRGDLIGVMLNRHPHFLIAMLGILKAGGAYVPLSPTYPKERLQYLLADTRPKVLLTQSEYLFDLDYFEGNIFALDVQLEGLPPVVGHLTQAGNSEDLAYVMYTSGTTGKPKGVMIEHRSVVRLVQHTSYIQLGPEDRLLQTSSLAFDASTFEVWGMWLNGGVVYLLSDEQLLKNQVMKEIIQQEAISVMWLTSSWFNQLVETDLGVFNGLKQLLVGGEKLSARHIQRVRQAYPGLSVINGYGPTENTTFSICYPIQSDFAEEIPLGYPIANSQVYILDNLLRPVPMGIEGEIYLGGDGLARGYLNNPELTQQKFIAHPYAPAQRLYKTGDVGKWLEDGKVAFVGRRDSQLKIRGYRVEPAEIEQVLLGHPQLTQAVVLGFADDQEINELVAFVVGEVTEADLRHFLASQLPTYLIPAEFVVLDTLPLTANGKVDKRALSLKRVDQATKERHYEAPRDLLDRQLAEIWQEVLRTDRIGIDDNFFELGGHSLRATQLVSRVYKQLEASIDLGQVFAFPTIRQLAEIIKGGMQTGYEEIPRIPEAPNYEVSAGQKRLWVLNQLEGEHTTYNMSGSYELEGDFSFECLEKVFNILQERHEILRTTFEMPDGEVRQVVHPVGSLQIKPVYRDLTQVKGAEQKIDDIIRAAVSQKFDLSKEPLLRVNVLKMNADKHICLFVMHHIISDGWSLKVTMHELAVLYQACREGRENPLEPLRIQYKDYAAWQRTQSRGEALKKHRLYAAQEFGGELPVLNLPTSMPRPDVKSIRGSLVETMLDRPTTLELNALSQKYRCSLFMTLLAGFNALLYRYSGQQDLIVGTVDAGRAHPDLEDQIGFYVNTLAIRMQFDGDDTLEELLEKTKRKVLQAYEHLSYPFDELLSDLNVQWDRSRSPLFDVVLSLQNTDVVNLEAKEHLEEGKEENEMAMRGYKNEVSTSMFDLVLNLNETPYGLVITTSYNSDLFTEASILTLNEHFMQVLRSMVSDSTGKINALLSTESLPSSGDSMDHSLDYEFNF